MRSLRQALQALDNNVTVQDNFGPSGAPEGSIIVSVGREKKPVWASGGSTVISNIVEGTIRDHQSDLIGPAGPSGSPGPPGPAGDAAGMAEPLVDGLGDIVYFYHDGAESNLDLLMVFNS